MYGDHIFLKNIKDKLEIFKVSYVSKLVCNCQESVHYEIFLSLTLYYNNIAQFSDSLKLIRLCWNKLLS